MRSRSSRELTRTPVLHRLQLSAMVRLSRLVMYLQMVLQQIEVTWHLVETFLLALFHGMVTTTRTPFLSQKELSRTISTLPSILKNLQPISVRPSLVQRNLLVIFLILTRRCLRCLMKKVLLRLVPWFIRGTFLLVRSLQRVRAIQLQNSSF